MEMNPSVSPTNNTVSYFSKKNHNRVHLHSNYIEILYGHYLALKRIVNEMKSSFDLDYFSMTIINPNHQLVTFSTHPNIEFNLIHSGFWRFDKTIAYQDNPDNTILWWEDEDCYTRHPEKLKFFKLLNNGFSWGTTLCMQINNFCLLYGFAGKTNYQKNSIHGSFLKDIGNYLHHQLSHIISIDSLYLFPQLNITRPKLYKTKTTQFLRLLKTEPHS